MAVIPFGQMMSVADFSLPAPLPLPPDPTQVALQGFLKGVQLPHMHAHHYEHQVNMQDLQLAGGCDWSKLYKLLYVERVLRASCHEFHLPTLEKKLDGIEEHILANRIQKNPGEEPTMWLKKHCANDLVLRRIRNQIDDFAGYVLSSHKKSFLSLPPSWQKTLKTQIKHLQTQAEESLPYTGMWRADTGDSAKGTPHFHPSPLHPPQEWSFQLKKQDLHTMTKNVFFEPSKDLNLKKHVFEDKISAAEKHSHDSPVAKKVDKKCLENFLEENKKKGIENVDLKSFYKYLRDEIAGKHKKNLFLSSKPKLTPEQKSDKILFEKVDKFFRAADKEIRKAEHSEQTFLPFSMNSSTFLHEVKNHIPRIHPRETLHEKHLAGTSRLDEGGSRGGRGGHAELDDVYKIEESHPPGYMPSRVKEFLDFFGLDFNNHSDLPSSSPPLLTTSCHKVLPPSHHPTSISYSEPDFNKEDAGEGKEEAVSHSSPAPPPPPLSNPVSIAGFF